MQALELLEAFVHPDSSIAGKERLVFHLNDIETYLEFFDEDENGRDMVLIPHSTDVEVFGTYIH